ncbi:exported hypothetical protein [Gammaproteobacteria bacterium]
MYVCMYVCMYGLISWPPMAAADTPINKHLPTKRDQTIDSINFSQTAFTVGDSIIASATATSGLPVSFTTNNSSICVATGVNGQYINAISTGNCIVGAYQTGNLNYNASQITLRSISISKRSQTIGTIDFEPGTLKVNGTTIVVANATSGLPVAFSSTTPTICTIGGADGDAVTGVAAGICTIAATQSGNGTYNAATRKTESITVDKRNQTIGAISFTPTTLAVGRSNTVSATATSGLAVSFRSATPNICAVNGRNVTNISVGTCTITATQSGNTIYSSATRNGSNVVAKGTNTIGTISFNPTTLVVGGATTASATATSGLPVTFSSRTSSICTTGGTNGSTVTGVAGGTCTVAANQAASTNWTAPLCQYARDTNYLNN